MLKALGSQLQRQQACPTSLLPRIQAAGFAKKKGKDDDSGPDPKINRLLKASSMHTSSLMHLRRSHFKDGHTDGSLHMLAQLVKKEGRRRV